MTERGEALAAEIVRRVGDLDALIVEISPASWPLPSPEGWPLGFVAHHITLGLARQRRWIERRLRSGTVHEFSWETTNEMNARIVRRIGLPDAAVVRRCLRERGDAMIALVRRLTEEELDMDAFTFGEHRRSIEWVIRRVALRHIDEHAASITAALGTATG